MSWKDIVKSVAPVLGTALGGPFGAIATNTIASALFGDDELPSGTALIAKINTELTANPQALAKLKEADQAFDIKMKELEVDILQIDADDRANARSMQIATKSWILPVLSAVTTVAFFAMVAWILAGKVTLDSTLLGIIIGVVGTKADQVYNFHYGSSQGSKNKDNKPPTKEH